VIGKAPEPVPSKKIIEAEVVILVTTGQQIVVALKAVQIYRVMEKQGPTLASCSAKFALIDTSYTSSPLGEGTKIGKEKKMSAVCYNVGRTPDKARYQDNKDRSRFRPQCFPSPQYFS
jgi:hypothetical protein